jgi:phytoene dehydrogenase-like protein
MTASFTFDVIFVGTRHNALIVARCLARDSGSVCLLDQRPLPAKPRTAPSESFLEGGDENCGRPKLTRPRDPSSESFMDDPEDFKKRSRIGSPYENPTSHSTYGQPKGEHLTATRAAIARTTPVWLYGRVLRDAAGIPDSTRVQRRRYRFRGGCLQANLALSSRPGSADSQLDGGGGINVGHGLNELITFTRQSEDELLPTHPWISWHEPTTDPDCESGGRAALPLQVLHAPLHPTGDAAAVIAGPGDLASGHNALAQAFTQFPIPAHRGGYSTGVTDLYQVGAASWPRPAVSGSSGRAVARGLLNRT